MNKPEKKQITEELETQTANVLEAALIVDAAKRHLPSGADKASFIHIVQKALEWNVPRPFFFDPGKMEEILPDDLEDLIFQEALLAGRRDQAVALHRKLMPAAYNAVREIAQKWTEQFFFESLWPDRHVEIEINPQLLAKFFNGEKILIEARNWPDQFIDLCALFCALEWQYYSIDPFEAIPEALNFFLGGEDLEEVGQKVIEKISLKTPRGKPYKLHFDNQNNLCIETTKETVK